MGLWLQQQQIIPDLILSSPAERAISTTEKLCKAMGLDVCMIQQEKHLYAAGVKTLKNILAGCSKEAKRVMLVGHNPELEILLMNLAGNQIKIPDDGKLLATATLARLQMPGDWHVLNKGCAKVLSITRAASLP